MVSNRFTNSNNPQHVNSRIFIGNIDCEKVTREELEGLYSKYGEILGISMHKTFAFVQFNNESSAKTAASETHQNVINNKKIDVNVASERRKQQHPSREREGINTHARSSDVHSTGPRMRGPSRFSDNYSYNSPYGYDRPPVAGNISRAAPYYSQSTGGYASSQYVGYPPVVPQPPQPGANQPNLVNQSEMWSGYAQNMVAAAPMQAVGTAPGSYQQPPSTLRTTDREFAQAASVLSSATIRSPVECEVIATTPKFNNYAEYLSGQVTARGLKCNVNIPSHESLVQSLKNRALSTGVPFCILIENGSEIHPSITLCLYFSSPEEHRNMTIDSALELLQVYIVRLGYGTGLTSGSNVAVSAAAANASASTAVSHKSAGQMTFPAVAVKYPNYGVESREVFQSGNYSAAAGTLLPR